MLDITARLAIYCAPVNPLSNALCGPVMPNYPVEVRAAIA